MENIMTEIEMENIITGNEIRIVSGEGTYGTVKVYKGKMTVRAIKSRLKRERCNGDRWARAIQYRWETKDGVKCGQDLETGEMKMWPTID